MINYGKVYPLRKETSMVKLLPELLIRLKLLPLSPGLYLFLSIYLYCDRLKTKILKNYW